MGSRAGSKQESSAMVARGAEDPVQGDGQLHHAERRRKVAAVLGDHADDGITQFLRQLLLAGKGKPRNIFGEMQAGEQGRVDHGNPWD